MSLLGAIRSTARLSDWMFRHAFPVYALLYNRYKRLTEADVIACIDRSVRPGDRVVDIGANIGFYAALLAERVGPTGAVWAFEPEPINHERLAARTRLYPQVHAVAACVGEHTGTAELFLSDTLNVDHRSYPTDEARHTIQVAATSLDSFFSDGEQLTFVKMDVQGAEYAALLGMRAVVARSPNVTLLFECWPLVHNRFGPGVRAIITLLEDWGFQAYRLTAGGTTGERFRADSPLPGDDTDHNYFDLLCMRSKAVV